MRINKNSLLVSLFENLYFRILVTAALLGMAAIMYAPLLAIWAYAGYADLQLNNDTEYIAIWLIFMSSVLVAAACMLVPRYPFFLRVPTILLFVFGVVVVAGVLIKITSKSDLNLLLLSSSGLVMLYALASFRVIVTSAVKH